METTTPDEWIARCAHRLHRRWTTVDAADLRETATLIWDDSALRALAPEIAATQWLPPVTVGAQ